MNTTIDTKKQIRYSIKDTDLFLDVSTPREREYVLRVRDLPKEDQPREKLLSTGPGALSVSELLAIVLGSGTKKEGVLEMSEKIVKEYGERVLSRQVNAEEMATELDIPLFKAMQVVAVSELGRRFFDKTAGGMAVLRTPEDAYNYLHDMHNLPKEHVRGIYLNAHHQVIHDEVISIGTVNSNLIHPREVFRPALQYGAAGVILAHNHPSGVMEASISDIEVTNQLIESGKILGITLIDHIIVSGEKFISIDVDYNA
ncbi:MAG TPA: DNA repair protein RadC [Candidatus Paceibacterota bacterium]|nr:DNA repair protein RadC [Candidatus Paceibacterota bacterium]